MEDEVEQEAYEEEVEQGSLCEGGNQLKLEASRFYVSLVLHGRSRAYHDCHQKDSGEVVEECLVVERVGSLQYDPDMATVFYILVYYRGCTKLEMNNLRGQKVIEEQSWSERWEYQVDLERLDESARNRLSQ